MHFLPCPQHKKDLDKAWMKHVKIAQNMYIFLQILHLSSNRREQNLALYFQFMTSARKLTHTTKFECFWMQKDTNFGNAMILCHFGPEKCQNQTQKDTNFGNAMILQQSGPENHQKILPRKTRISGSHNSSLPWARETPKSNHERHEF